VDAIREVIKFILKICCGSCGGMEGHLRRKQDTLRFKEFLYHREQRKEKFWAVSLGVVR
jgi:hypothetical protein